MSYPNDAQYDEQPLEERVEGKPTGGKSPAVATDQAEGRESTLGAASGPTEGTSVPYAPNIPDNSDPDKAWERYALDAVHTIYPHLRDDVDFAIGRRELGGPIELLDQSDLFAPIDMGKVEELARKMAASDPYVDYKAKPGLAPGSELGPGEVDPRNRELPPNVAQSEVNPAVDEDEKVPTQEYQGQ